MVDISCYIQTISFPLKMDCSSNQPVHVSPRLHVVQRSNHYVHGGVEGVAVDVFRSWTHLV